MAKTDSVRKGFWVRTRVMLPRKLLNLLDARVGRGNRSSVIEEAVRSRLEAMARDRQAADIATINRRSVALNREAADVLDYQTGTF